MALLDRSEKFGADWWTSSAPKKITVPELAATGCGTMSGYFSTSISFAANRFAVAAFDPFALGVAAGHDVQTAVLHGGVVEIEHRRINVRGDFRYPHPIRMVLVHWVGAALLGTLEG